MCVIFFIGTCGSFAAILFNFFFKFKLDKLEPLMWDIGPNVNCQLVKRSEDEANFIRAA